VPVDDGNVSRDAAERAGREQAAEAGADDDYFGPRHGITVPDSVESRSYE
jgi:hypothetical protein